MGTKFPSSRHANLDELHHREVCLQLMHTWFESTTQFPTAQGLSDYMVRWLAALPSFRFCRSSVQQGNEKVHKRQSILEKTQKHFSTTLHMQGVRQTACQFEHTSHAHSAVRKRYATFVTASKTEVYHASSTWALCA